jgi:hypothetical protein
MPHITSIERRGLERGRAEGQAKMLLRAVQRRYDAPVPEDLAARIRDTTDLALLEQWLDWTYEIASLEEFNRRIQGRQ